jgi:hypothetical protein
MSNSTFLEIKRTDKYLLQTETPLSYWESYNSSEAAEKLIVPKFTNILWCIYPLLSDESVNKSRCYATGD